MKRYFNNSLTVNLPRWWQNQCRNY